MADSKRIAGLVGPALMAVTASEAVNLHIWVTHSATLVYLNGCLLFVAGLAIVRAHNLWTWRWPAIVTVIGWLAMAGGLFRMFAPEAPQLRESPFTYGFIAALFASGCVLTFNAYARPNDED